VKLCLDVGSSAAIQRVTSKQAGAIYLKFIQQQAWCCWIFLLICRKCDQFSCMFKLCFVAGVLLNSVFYPLPVEIIYADQEF
jgi:hypothetical protein